MVIDEIINILHFNPGCCIVLHISQQFSFVSEYLQEEEFLKVLAEMDNVIVNPNRLRTGFEDIIQCHMSNFRFAADIIDFEYIVFASSNELYIRTGLWDDIRNYEYGPKTDIVLSKDTQWIQGIHVFEDNEFLDTLRDRNISTIYCGQFEGSFMKREMMLRMCDDIESFYDYRKMTVKYAREEIFFHTFLAAFYPKAKVRDENTTYMDWEKDLRVSVADVMNICRTQKGKFSLKRVQRNVNDEVRYFIREYIGCYGKEENLFFKNTGDVLSDSSLVAENRKNELKRDIFFSWIKVQQKGIKIADYLLEQGWTDISIYGYGDIGKLLYKVVSDNKDAKIECIIDKANADSDGKVKISEPFPMLEKSKALIVTALNDKDLLKQLKLKYSIQIIEVYDLLKDILESN